MKKLGRVLMVAGVAALGFFGWNTVQGTLNNSSIETTPPPAITATSIPLMDSIAAINSEVAKLKTTDEAILSKLEQIKTLLQMIEGELAALQKVR